MSDLLAARSQMAMSLAFHILFAVAGIGMPVLMAVAEGRWLRYRDPLDRELAQRWAKGTAILFAVGAVSGTVLSFELGLLWPEFMALAGPVIGMPFSLEGFAFFLEAIFLGLYLYGWDRLGERTHFWCGIGVAVSGALSGIFVVTANAWMNAPTGYVVADGRVVDVDPWAAMFNAAAPSQTLHMTLAAFAALGFAVAGVHAWQLRGQPGHRFHRRALAIALAVGGPAALLQPLSGDLSAKFVARAQPAKFAAMEALWETGPRAPLILGGWPDEDAEVTRWALHIPALGSILAFGDPDAVVIGLKDIPPNERPPVAVVHVAYQLMVACGLAMVGLTLLAGWLYWRRRALPVDRWFLNLVVACAPLGLVAIEAGWTVTEVGRQPWIIQGEMLVAEAVTPMPGLVVPFAVFTLLYLVLGAVVVVMLRRHVLSAPADAPAPAASPGDA